MTTESRLPYCNCFAVRQASRRVTKIYDRHLAPSRISATQFTIAMVLEENNGMVITDLADLLQTERTTLVRALRVLQSDGVVATSPSARDARQFVFSLTPLGKQRLETAIPLWENAQQEIETSLGTNRTLRMRRDFHALARSE